MSYIGNLPSEGENNSFKILDSISSYTQTFDGSSAAVVSLVDETLTFNNHRFITAQRVTYSTTGSAIGGLISGTAYYIIKNDQNTVKLALTESDANNNNFINFTALGTGTTHTLNIAFDGINKKFKATYDNGTKAQITRAAQLQISINGVIQQPQDTISPANGFGIDLDSVIIFSIAPIISDVFWGNLFANNFPTFDIADNTVDSFTGNAVLTDFTLSKTPANNQNILVTIDGVVQYPSDATTTRAYTLYENVLSFVSAPGNGTAIQARHIGFAGATSSSVTGFYGRTGNVVLTSQDNINVGNVSSSGIITATTLSISSGAVVNGVVTATSFNGNITGSINPTSLNVSGVSTFQASSFWGDGDIAYFGDGQDLLIFHNSTDSIIRDNGTGDLYIEGGNRIRFTNPTALETYAVFNQDGASELYYDNVKKIETTSGGISVSGNLVFPTAGNGIDFSATSDGSGTMSSELLADYEEGTWTPVPNGVTIVSGSPTYTGTYTRIGRAVHVSMFQTAGTITVAAGNYFTGLPFTPANYHNTGSWSCAATGKSGVSNVFTNGAIYIQQVISNGTSLTQLMSSATYTV